MRAVTLLKIAAYFNPPMRSGFSESFDIECPDIDSFLSPKLELHKPISKTLQAIMSAPNAGRQSPEPDKQSHQQVGAPESGQIDAAPSKDHAKDASNEHKDNTLSSNLEGPLEAAAHEKVSKEGRGNV